MRKKSSILKSFLATASLCGSLLSSFNATATGIVVTTTGLVDVNLSNGSGLVGGIFNNNNIIKVVASSPGVKILANKADATIAKDTIGGAVYAGAGNLTSTGNFTGGADFKGNGGTFYLGAGKTLTGSAISTNKRSGTFVFVGDGTVTQDLGTNLAGLTQIIFNGTNEVRGGVDATTLTVNAGADATIAKDTAGNAVYDGAGKLTSTGKFTGNIDFKNQAGILTLGDGSTIDIVTSTGGVAGTLNFTGNGQVTQNIGTDAQNSPAIINIQGDNTTNVVLGNNVFAGNINFTNAGKIQLSGNLTTPNLDFKATGGTLEFSGNGQYILDATINGDNGVLNVLATLTATNVGTLKTINIGNNLASQIFTIKENNPNVTLLNIANSSINFNNINSELVISAPVEQAITFASSLAGFTGGGGTISLDGSTAKLTVSGQNGVTLGTDGNALTALNIMGNVIISDNLDVHNANQLNIKAGANLTDQSLTSALIQNIVIGEAGANGAATYGLDAESKNFGLNSAKMTFANPDSALNLQNSSNNTDRTITLTGILSPGGDQFGKVQLTTENNKLTIDGNGFSLGADHKRLKELDFISTGSGTIDLNVGIFVEKISLGVNAIELGEVNSDVYFTKGTIYSATGNINGKVDFQGNAGIINLADGVNINGTATSTGIQNGTLTFLGTGQVTDLITNIAMLKAGAGDVSLIVGGNYSIDEIQGNGNNNITFAAGTNLTGSINTSGGQAVNLIFTNGGSVSDSIGSSAAVGNITVQAGIVSFGNTVNGIPN
ncbi:MAG: hypothetical protein LN566_02790 [Rickettsia endosymbiont of Stiretrus anchorago]|nr:hypothetical protein [Rickettsia endosymbiont of Stiretrus anchorago]